MACIESQCLYKGALDFTFTNSATKKESFTPESTAVRALVKKHCTVPHAFVLISQCYIPHSPIQLTHFAGDMIVKLQSGLN
jgi:hypothetical protein